MGNSTLLLVFAIVLLAAAVVTLLVGLAALRRARAQRAGGTATGTRSSASVDPFRDNDADALRGDPRALKPGDIVEIRGVSYAVRGSLLCSEGSWSWSEHFLDDAQGRRVWLSVEEDPDLELVLWTEVPSATVRPDRPTVEFGGRRYTRDESGQARFTGTGTTGLAPSGSLRYHDYAAPDGAQLSFERYGDSETWEVGTGETLHRAEVTIYPQAG